MTKSICSDPHLKKGISVTRNGHKVSLTGLGILLECPGFYG